MIDNDLKILLIEDDDIDVMGIKRALKELRIINPLIRARDGLEGLDILRGKNGHTKLLEPYLILLDLNMPRMGGLEFLETIRNDAKLKNTIVFVMTTSSDEKDIFAAYERHIAGYIIKSDMGNTFISALEMLGHFWRIVEIPSSDSIRRAI